MCARAIQAPEMCCGNQQTVSDVQVRGACFQSNESRHACAMSWRMRSVSSAHATYLYLRRYRTVVVPRRAPVQTTLETILQSQRKERHHQSHSTKKKKKTTTMMERSSQMVGHASVQHQGPQERAGGRQRAARMPQTSSRHRPGAVGVMGRRRQQSGQRARPTCNTRMECRIRMREIR
jgi:hypothetical protein